MIMTPKTDFRDLSFNISNYCLSNCKYCNLNNPKHWGLDDEMNIEQIEAFLTDPILDHLDTIHLTGGEPYLSPKLPAIAEILAQYHGDVPINLPSNGLFPRLIEWHMSRIVKQLPQWRINVGLEGHNKEIHESIRGPGTWEPVLETIARMDKIDVPVVGNMSLYDTNWKYIRETKRLCDDLDIGFFLNFGRYSIRFGNDKDDIRYMENHEEAVKEITEAIKDIKWLEARKYNRSKWTIQNAFWEGKEVKWQCLAGIEGIDVFPNGDVFPCLMYYSEYKFGNIKEEYAVGENMPLTAVMSTDKAHAIQDKIYEGECSKNCRFTCQLRMDNLTIDGEEQTWLESL